MNTNTEKTQRQLPHEKMLKRTPETEKAGRNNGSKRVRVCMSVLVVVIVVVAGGLVPLLPLWGAQGVGIVLCPLGAI